MHDLREARNRRRFYLDRGLRKRPVGAGSDLRALMALPRDPSAVNPGDLFGAIPVLVIGGVATRAYAPERQTKDTDFLFESASYAEAIALLRKTGWRKTVDLFFPNSSLGLRGEAFEKDGVFVDLITSDQEWVSEAFVRPTHDQTGLRVIPLAYLVLMKLDSARGIDQGDLTRMLGRLDAEQVEEIAGIVDRHAHDAQAADDVRQYALLGRMEWDSHADRTAGAGNDDCHGSSDAAR
jgi:hypothetical protein